MPQGSVGYAVARITVRSRDALDASRLDRLLGAGTYPEALRALAEIGWTGADTGADAEDIAAVHVEEACALVKKVTPCPEATDSLLLRYDGLNLKALLKARMLGRTATRLSKCGVFPVETLTHAVAEHSYKKLGDTLGPALDALEETLAVREDALAVDTAVDQAVFALIEQNMRHVKSPVIRNYFTGRADMLGAIMLLRIRRMGRDAQFFLKMLLPGGSIPNARWAAAFERPELIPGMMLKYGPAVFRAAQAAVQDAQRLPALEKAMDDALIAPFSRLKADALRLEPVFAHILGAEREAAAVRLILAAKKNGFASGAIQERLRVPYGS